MIVKFLQNSSDKHFELDCCQDVNTEYFVYGVFFSAYKNSLFYNLLDKESMKITSVEAKLYIILNNKIPPNWIFETQDSGKGFIIFPNEFNECCDGNFEEYYHNANPYESPIMGQIRSGYKEEQNALKIVEEVTKKLQQFHQR